MISKCIIQYLQVRKSKEKGKMWEGGAQEHEDVAIGRTERGRGCQPIRGTGK